MKLHRTHLFAAGVVLAAFIGAAGVLTGQETTGTVTQDPAEADFGGGGGWGGGGWGGGGGGGNSATYGGRAFAVDSTIAAHHTTVADTGELPSTGGNRNATVLDVNVPNVLTAQVAHAVVVGANGRTRAEASLETMNMNVAGQTLTADLVAARAVSGCSSGGAMTQGRSDIVNLTLNGAPVTVTGDPNQMIEIPGIGHIVINEQTRDVGANAAHLTVNALHVVIDNVADVIVSHADSNIGCSTAGCVNTGDSVHGCGWINTTGTARGKFGIAAGSRPSTTGGNPLLWGHLSYIDQAANVRVRAMNVTSYTLTNATTRTITGNADVNGQSRTYTVVVTDSGDAGVPDTFSIQLSSGYTASGNLVRGNIQIHEACAK